MSAVVSDPDRATAGLRAIWRRRRAEVIARVDAFDDAAAALATGDPADEVLARARAEAHKLAGSLGMFGFEVPLTWRATPSNCSARAGRSTGVPGRRSACSR